MRNFLALLLLLSCSFVSLQAQESWSLQKCVEYARQNSLTVKQAQYGVLQSELDNKQARMNLLPNLSANVRGGYQFGRTIDPTTNEFKNESIGFNGFNVDAGVTLFSGLVIQNSIKQSKFDVMASKLDAEATANDISLQVASSYLSILLAEEQLENAKVRLALSEAQLAQTDKLIAAGSVPPNENLDIIAQIARDQQTIIEADNLVNINYLTLKQLLELDPNTDIKIVRPEVVIPAANPEAFSLEEVFNSALSTQPQIEAGMMRSRSAQIGERIAYGRSFPTLNVGAGMSSNFSTIAQAFASYSEQIEQNFGQYVSVNLNIPIYSNHRNKVGLDRARLVTLNQDVANRQAKNLLKTNVQRAIADAKAAKESYAAAQRSEEAADVAYENAKRSYNLGAINSLEFTTASNNLNQAKVSLIQAKYQYLFNLKVVDFYMGKTLEIN
ncbi:MAG: TolC family protein [Saprospiraceae bacterium]|nr:TolC family protein [Saprospiraceae bacterium]